MLSPQSLKTIRRMHSLAGSRSYNLEDIADPSALPRPVALPSLNNTPLAWHPQSGFTLNALPITPEQAQREVLNLIFLQQYGPLIFAA